MEEWLALYYKIPQCEVEASNANEPGEGLTPMYMEKSASTFAEICKNQRNRVVKTGLAIQ